MSRARVRRMIAFVLITYGIAWAWWIPLALADVVVEPGQGWPSHLPGLLAPAVAAVLVTAVTEGRHGLADLWSRITRWRVRWVWYAAIAATAALLLVPLLSEPRPVADAFVTYSGAPIAGLWVVLYVVVVNGFGEEIGWRGYLADSLMREHSLAVAALVVWVVWAGWHLPLFWIVGSFREFGVVGTVGWIVGIGFGSLVLTWIYRSASRSILIVALWHAAYNFSTATQAASGLSAAIASVVVMVVGVGVLCLRGSWRRPGIGE